MSRLTGTADIEERIHRLPIVDHLNLRIRLLDNGQSEVTITDVAPFHLGGVEGEYLNGGIILSMLDAAIASVALNYLGGRRCGTVELSTRILKPVPPDPVMCRGYIIRRSGRLVFARAELLSGRTRSAEARGIVSATRRNEPSEVNLHAPRKVQD